MIDNISLWIKRFGLVSLFNGTSIFVCYLMQKVIVVEEQLG